MNELSPSVSSNSTLLVFRARRVPLEAIGRYQPGDRQTDRQTESETERQKERDREREREAERERARAVKTVLSYRPELSMGSFCVIRSNPTQPSAD